MRGDEKRVVDAFCRWLQASGWEIAREQAFVDVVATRDGITLYAEAKGLTAAIGLDIDTMYGQILRRMPIEARAAVLRVSHRVRQLLRIEVYCVDEKGGVFLVAD